MSAASSSNSHSRLGTTAVKAVVSLVAWAVGSPGVSLVAINLRRTAAVPHRSDECGAAILLTTLRDVEVGA